METFWINTDNSIMHNLVTSLMILHDAFGVCVVDEVQLLTTVTRLAVAASLDLKS